MIPDPQQPPETRRISYSWEVSSAQGVNHSDVLEVPADATDELIDEIVSDTVHSESGFSWGWSDASAS